MTLIRRLILSLALIAGISPAMAQVPAPVPALPDQHRIQGYLITASTCNCAVNFALYGDGTDYQNWVEVWINGTRVNYNDATYGWTITSPSGSLSTLPRPVTNAVLTFNSVQTGEIQIVGARRPRRAAQFAENTGVSARNLNQVFTDVIATQRELWDKTSDVTGRGLFFAPGFITGPMPLPAACANNLLGFDATGLNPTCVSVLNIGNLVACGTAGAFPVFNEGIWKCSTASPPRVAALNGTLNITPLPLSYQPGLQISQSTPASGSLEGPLLLNRITGTMESTLTGGGGAGGKETMHLLNLQLYGGGVNYHAQSAAAFSAVFHHVLDDTSPGDMVGGGTFIDSTAARNGGGKLYGFASGGQCSTGCLTAALIGQENDMFLVGTGTAGYVVGYAALTASTKAATTASAAYSILSAGGSISPWTRGVLFSDRDLTNNTFTNAPIASTGHAIHFDYTGTIDTLLNAPNITMTNVFSTPGAFLTGPGLLTLGTTSTASSGIVLLGSAGSTLNFVVYNGATATWAQGYTATDSFFGAVTGPAAAAWRVNHTTNLLSAESGLTVSGSFTATGLLHVGDLATASKSTTVNGQTCTLAGTCTVTAAATTITPGTTTIVGATAPCAIVDTTGTTMGCITLTNSYLAAGTFSNITGVGTLTAGSVPTTLLTGTLQAAQEPAHSGDVTNTAGSLALTLATAQPAVHTWALAQTFTVAPVFTDQSGSRTALGLGTAATQNTGTSGANVPLLNGANTWSAAQTLSAALTYGGVTLTNAVTGTGKMVLDTAPTLATPVIGVATATSVNKVAITAPATSATLTIADGTTLTQTTSTSVGRGQYQGTGAADNATAGNIGELIESSIAVGSAVALTSAADKTVTSVVLTAGDWDVWGNVAYTANGAAVISATTGAISTVNNTVPGAPNGGAVTSWFGSGTGFAPTTSAGRFRISTTGQTVYLVTNAQFSSTMSAFGYIGARRVR